MTATDPWPNQPQSDPWSDAPAPPSGTYVKWQIMGMPVAGRITAITKVTNRFKKEETDPDSIMEMSLAKEDGSTVIVSLRPVDLYAKLWEAKPGVGDFVTITWTGVETMPAGTKKVFTVQVAKAF